MVGNIIKIMRPKKCMKCNKQFVPSVSTQVYCGSKTRKVGCSWDMVHERDRIRGKDPERIKKTAILSKEWKKKQRALNTDYAKKQRALKLAWSKTDNGKECHKKSYAKRLPKKLEENRIRSILKKGCFAFHTNKEWDELKASTGNRCIICGVGETELLAKHGKHFSKLTRDHIFPLSLGGTDCIENIQPLCVSCNARKHKHVTNPTIILSGGVDCIHVGHVRMIKEASLYGKVIFIINSDEWLIRKKGYKFMTWNERAEIIAHMKGVVGIIKASDDDGTVCKTIEDLHKKGFIPTYFANGGDRKQDNTPEVALCNKLGIKLLWNIGGGKIQSSSELIKKAAENVKAKGKKDI